MSLCAGLINRQGKVLVHRTFCDEVSLGGLLPYLSRTIPIMSLSERTMLNFEQYRCIYQPLENTFFIFLATRRSSNIIEDRETLDLLVRIVKSFIGSGNLTEEEISNNMFNIIFAWDEAITNGVNNHLSISEIQTNLAMYSYDEILELSEKKEKERAAKKFNAQKLRELEEVRSGSYRRRTNPIVGVIGYALHGLSSRIDNGQSGTVGQAVSSILNGISHSIGAGSGRSTNNPEFGHIDNQDSSQSSSGQTSGKEKSWMVGFSNEDAQRLRAMRSASQNNKQSKQQYQQTPPQQLEKENQIEEKEDNINENEQTIEQQPVIVQNTPSIRPSTLQNSKQTTRTTSLVLKSKVGSKISAVDRLQKKNSPFGEETLNSINKENNSQQSSSQNKQSATQITSKQQQGPSLLDQEAINSIQQNLENIPIIRCEEKIGAKFDRTGTLQSVQLLGEMMIQGNLNSSGIKKSGFGLSITRGERVKEFTFRSNPKVDMSRFTQKDEIVPIQDSTLPSKLVRWKSIALDQQHSQSNILPIRIPLIPIVWLPEALDDNKSNSVTIEYNHSLLTQSNSGSEQDTSSPSASLEYFVPHILHNVIFEFNANKSIIEQFDDLNRDLVTNTDHGVSINTLTNKIVWRIGTVSADDSSARGSVDIRLPHDSLSHIFPLVIYFTSSELYCPIQIVAAREWDIKTQMLKSGSTSIVPVKVVSELVADVYEMK
ncbi:MAG: hypothetical protein EZS28_022432 [Streblomastix strix]|uniref:Coatomer subunit delta n=1 Tax=Streblomastix strix TaxID=222440 RepID=A0A5J4VHI2_9EUKA|nr:MAG: hypothetical protein EZS28_022432 [Streblomastix strix]